MRDKPESSWRPTAVAVLRPPDLLSACVCGKRPEPPMPVWTTASVHEGTTQALRPLNGEAQHQRAVEIDTAVVVRDRSLRRRRKHGKGMRPNQSSSSLLALEADAAEEQVAAPPHVEAWGKMKAGFMALVEPLMSDPLRLCGGRTRFHHASPPEPPSVAAASCSNNGSARPPASPTRPPMRATIRWDAEPDSASPPSVPPPADEAEVAPAPAPSDDQ